MDILDKMYDLLSVNSQSAFDFAESELSKIVDQTEKDDLNWAKAYALCDLKRFDEAKNIWLDIYLRTQNHKALHQVGMVEREAGNLTAALEIYQKERELIDTSDKVAVGANLYELTYCSLLAGLLKDANDYFSIYESVQSNDLTERGCFYRLKGDLYKSIDIKVATSSYLKSKEIFDSIGSDYAAKEIEERLKNLALK